MTRVLPVVLAVLLLSASAFADDPPATLPSLDSLPMLWDGQTKQVNALWGENPKDMQFGDGRSKVVIADIKGPGVITMIHFALPQTMKLNRDTVLRIYWDGEKTPSVESPLVDFFCDPNGALERVDSVLVNKKRGWNCYFPMPFAKSARVEVEMDSRRYPGGSWSKNPCYSYVIYRTLKSIPRDIGYFHGCWRQQTVLLGAEPYRVFEAKGRGQFVGWSMTVRGVGTPNAGYPVDENVCFYVDGEKEPSIEWQGLEDSFGFSWGFPEQANGFQYTGYQPYYNGAAAYRFTVNDRISFSKAMNMTVEFGKHETSFFRQEFSKPENPLQFSSVAYWYQREPHVPHAVMPSGRDRGPSMLAAVGKTEHEAGETLVLDCGSAAGDDTFLADGWDFVFRDGYVHCGDPWPGPINYCWAGAQKVEFDITCPRGTAGTLQLYIIDADNFCGGRKQSITVGGRLIGEYEGFQQGKWIDVPISASDTAGGRIPVVVKNTRSDANAVMSIVKFRAEKGTQ